MEKEKEGFNNEITDLDKLVAGHEAELAKKETEQSQFFSQFKGLIEKRNKLDKEATEKEGRVLGIDQVGRKEEMTMNLLSMEEAKVKAETAGLTAEFEQYSGIELDMEKPEEQLKKEINEFERMMVNIGNVNMRALEIYETVEKEYGILLNKKNVLLTEKDSVMGMMNEIERNKKDLFMKTLTVVDGQFRRIFSQLTTKGEAYLEIENKEDPFAAGLKFNVRISGNKFIDIRSLSGGEKTMTGLAFLFAIQEHEPATFYILDEVDAALDKHNSEKLAKLIRSYCNKAQYVVISHNDAIISEGDVLYGVSMNQDAGLSNVVSLKM
jgi:chromosome segregation protein